MISTQFTAAAWLMFMTLAAIATMGSAQNSTEAVCVADDHECENEQYCLVDTIDNENKCV